MLRFTALLLALASLSAAQCELQRLLADQPHDYDVFTLSGSFSSYCVGAPNSTGVGATMSLQGYPNLAANNVVLRARDLPSDTGGFFFYGPSQTQLSVGDGFLCVADGGIGLFRLGPPSLASAQGLLEHQLDTTSPPALAGQITVGSTWNFQAVYRDVAAGATGLNFPDALRGIFAP